MRLTTDPLETVCANSYRNFHAKGFDYLCLERSPSLTRKVYFFGDNLTDLPEIVMPHDHRYQFHTTVLRGCVTNHVYRPGDIAGCPTGRFDHFRYLTPLNGGDGFEWAGERQLSNVHSGAYLPGQCYHSSADAIHTLQVMVPDTVILLTQFEDVVPVGKPTNAYRVLGSREPPNLSGLYDRMDPDHAVQLIAQVLSIL
jgi:hypothetical protein